MAGSSAGFEAKGATTLDRSGVTHERGEGVEVAISMLPTVRLARSGRVTGQPEVIPSHKSGSRMSSSPQRSASKAHKTAILTLFLLLSDIKYSVRLGGIPHEQSALL
jgi:hypothetical protein